MKKIASSFASVVLTCLFAIAAPVKNYHVFIAPATITANSVTLLWDKQYAKDTVVYQIWLNGKAIGTTTKTNYTVTNLAAANPYTVSILLLKNVTFTDIVLPEKVKVLINYPVHISFKNVVLASGAKPEYTQNSSANIVY
jgi:predicted metallopeptidase